MFKIISVLALMLASFNSVSGEQSMNILEQTEEENSDQLLGDYGIEQIRNIAPVLSEMTSEEKENFLSEAGVTEEEFNHFVAWSKLDWKTEGRHSLPKSHSTISLPEGYALVIGEEAVTVGVLGGEPRNEDIDAYVCGANVEAEIIFENYKTGYISIDDWSELDPKKMIHDIIQNTEKANKERRKRGISELHVIGWIQEPILDKNTKTVYWSIEANCGEDENIVNSVALRLGREGFEKIIWICSRSSYIPFGGHLDVMLSAHSFDEGYRYDDYTNGDKVASYGIAALVATTVGAKFIKTGGFLILLKKFGGFIFAGLAALFYKMKNIFTGRTNSKDSE